MPNSPQLEEVNETRKLTGPYADGMRLGKITELHGEPVTEATFSLTLYNEIENLGIMVMDRDDMAALIEGLTILFLTLPKH